LIDDEARAWLAARQQTHPGLRAAAALMNAIATLPRLARTLGMLGSDHDGEVLNAARQAERIRRALGCGWDALLQVPLAGAGVEAGRGGRQPPPWPADQPNDWREMIAACRRCPARLTAWETQFVASVAERRSLSAKQYAILRKLSEKAAA
jgi:hypothetical protein